MRHHSPCVMHQRTVVSAPGSVCLSGWYPSQKAVALPITARMYVAVATVECQGRKDVLVLRVRSPQFNQPSSMYIAIPSKGGVEVLRSTENTETNEYVHNVLGEVLREVRNAVGGHKFHQFMLEGGVDISIYADKDFYSTDPEEAAALQVDGLATEFCQWNSKVGDMTPNGIGSSAALCAALATALFVHMQVMNIDKSDYGLACVPAVRAHELCGRTNAHEVAAAFLGPTTFQTIAISTLKAQKQLLGNASPFSLPPLTTVLVGMMDVAGKARFENAARNWAQRRHEVGHSVFSRVAFHQEHIVTSLETLVDINDKDSAGYTEAITAASKTPPSMWTELTTSSIVSACVLRTLIDINFRNEGVRACLRETGNEDTIMLEPPMLTALLDHTLSFKGVIAAGLTGAGGASSIWALVCAPSVLSPSMAMSPVDIVEDAWARHPLLSIGPYVRSNKDRIKVEHVS
ncbi:hypothetical protein D9619_001302 [Psilocybe cf. subviscida]|uniref:phosphomevalonate kinase n=1 Tax=Psilocybe cf. subviscida TaxID=2480587 RepID=A0A8H5BFG7_9AGAR|nr:hypothetical protein D9619_001302 [Psilocybe cf. subviscida]